MRPASAEAPARAALAGNPSDGYGGRTVAVALPAFRARAWVEPAAHADVQEPLLRAALSRFARLTGTEPPPVRMRCATTIPERVGLAGSSGIVVAALRALASASGVQLTPGQLATAALEAETEELGIAAGPQDRVVQAHGGLVAMDFDPRHGRAGLVERLDPALLPPLFIAWQRDPAAPSGVFHSELRRRHDAGDAVVHEGIKRLGRLAAAARDALVAGDGEGFARCMEASFDTRRAMAVLDPAHVRMIELARTLGSAANFAGSGGAVVGTMPAGVAPAELSRAFAQEGCAVQAPAEVNAARRPPPGLSGGIGMARHSKPSRKPGGDARRKATREAVAHATRTSAARDAAKAIAAPDERRGTRALGGDPFTGELRKREVLPLLVLHFIHNGPSYGNQLMERISAVTEGVLSVNPNTMYPLLRQLEGRGLIEGSWEHPERRSRRYYSLTSEGEQELERLVREVRPFLESIAQSIDEIVDEVYGGD